MLKDTSWFTYTCICIYKHSNLKYFKYKNKKQKELMRPNNSSKVEYFYWRKISRLFILVHVRPEIGWQKIVTTDMIWHV